MFLSFIAYLCIIYNKMWVYAVAASAFLRNFPDMAFVICLAGA